MKQKFLSLSLFVALLFGLTNTYAQEERTLPKLIKLPKRKSKIKNVDEFVNQSFDLYKVLRRYDSLQIVGLEIPDELNAIVAKKVRLETKNLYEKAPEMIEDLTGNLSLKSIRATKNLLTTKKALTYMYKTMEYYVKENPDLLVNPEK